MKRSLLLLLTLLASFAGKAQIADVYTNYFKYVLDSVCAKNKIRGVTVAVYRPGEGIWQGAYGDSYAGTPITSDMYMPIGSNTKTFTSALLLKLEEEGKLTIDDTVGTWVTHKYVNGQITIKQLLNHTSGLAEYTENPSFFAALNADFKRQWAIDELMQFIDTPVAAPGAPWEYCNTNFLIASIIIEKVTGMPLHQAYRTYILTPQQLSETFCYPQEKPGTDIPHAWGSVDGKKWVDMYVDYDYSNIAFLSMATGAGALVSTAEDNVKFWHQLMTGKIINATSLDKMKDAIPLTSTDGYGLGIFKGKVLSNRTVYMHGGTCFGYLNENLYDTATGICITAITNHDSIGNSRLFSRVVVPLLSANLKMAPVGVKEVASAQTSVRLYPNPATDNIQLEITGTVHQASIHIMDMMGRSVHTGTVKSGLQAISVSHLPAGQYIARVSDGATVLHIQKVEITR